MKVKFYLSGSGACRGIFVGFDEELKSEFLYVIHSAGARTKSFHASESESQLSR